MIKNVIFDLSEVLLTGLKDTGLALGEKHNLPSEYHPAWASAKTPLLMPIVEEFFNGHVDEDAYIDAILERFPQIGTKEWLKGHIRENFIEIDGTREIIIELRKLGYKLGLLSVHGKEWVEYCEKKFDYHKLFDAISYSYEDEISKPHPDAFKKVLDKLGAIPEETLFIDDSDRNLKGAKNIGIDTLLFKDANDLRVGLKEILVDFK